MDANRSELESERLVIVKRRCIEIAPALLLSCGLFCLPGCESGSESLRGAMEEKESAENIGAGGSEADEESSGEIMMPTVATALQATLVPNGRSRPYVTILKDWGLQIYQHRSLWAR